MNYLKPFRKAQNSVLCEIQCDSFALDLSRDSSIYVPDLSQHQKIHAKSQYFVCWFVLTHAHSSNVYHCNLPNLFVGFWRIAGAWMFCGSHRPTGDWLRNHGGYRSLADIADELFRLRRNFLVYDIIIPGNIVVQWKPNLGEPFLIVDRLLVNEWT